MKFDTKVKNLSLKKKLVTVTGLINILISFLKC